MLYSILIYGVEGVAESQTPEETEAMFQKHKDLRARLTEEGTYRGSVKLMAPSTACHIAEKDRDTVVMDGPFAESKEQFLGYYLVESDSLDYVIEAAKALPQGIANMEVRAVDWAGGPLLDG